MSSWADACLYQYSTQTLRSYSASTPLSAAHVAQIPAHVSLYLLFPSRYFAAADIRPTYDRLCCKLKR